MQQDGEFSQAAPALQAWGFSDVVGKEAGERVSVISCYEAGPFGYTLHRQLAALGVTNYVFVRAIWDDNHTPRQDRPHRCDEHADRAGSVCAGNPHALALGGCLREEQERRRSESRRGRSAGGLEMMRNRGAGWGCNTAIV